MADAQSEVRVELRGVTLVPAAALAEIAKARVFIAMDTPPPVRTMLAIYEGDAPPRAVEVDHVVEIPDADSRGARGCYAKVVDDSRLEEHGRVGSEVLAGEPSSQASAEDAGSDTVAESANYAEAGGSDAQIEAEASEPQGPADPDPGKKKPEVTPSGGKKRKGRKRK